PDGIARGFEHRPLLDMRLEVAVDREAGTLAPRRRYVGERPSQGVTQHDTSRVADAECVFELIRAGKDGGPHSTGLEPTPLLVHPAHQLDRSPRFDPAIL